MDIHEAAMSIAQEIRQGAFEHNCAINNLSVYLGMSPSSLAAAMAADRLQQETAQCALEILNVMGQVRARVRFPVDWSQTLVIKPLLEEEVERYREAKNPTPDYFYVLECGGLRYFKCVRGGEVVMTPSIMNAAIFPELEMASRAGDRLRHKHETACQVIPTNNRTIRKKTSEMISYLEDVVLVNG
jgi:hypothetical protein